MTWRIPLHGLSGFFAAWVLIHVLLQVIALGTLRSLPAAVYTTSDTLRVGLILLLWAMSAVTAFIDAMGGEQS